MDMAMLCDDALSREKDTKTFMPKIRKPVDPKDTKTSSFAAVAVAINIKHQHDHGCRRPPLALDSGMLPLFNNSMPSS
jgi:hypothetical protein